LKTFFTSDIHFGHKNILKYDKRPFKHISEHDERIIENWNHLISNQDDVYYLGDFAFAPRDYIESILMRLNGRKNFIKGNHDKKDTIELYKKYGNFLGELRKISVNNQEIVLCHYAMKVWDKSHHGSWHLYGHSHGSLPDDIHSLSFDVGINNHDYEPIEFEQVKKIMSKKHFKPIDHHGKN
jgi:calcineurin-like phosphoesterase family protein